MRVWVRLLALRRKAATPLTKRENLNQRAKLFDFGLFKKNFLIFARTHPLVTCPEKLQLFRRQGVVPAGAHE